jgi:HK97 family phage major capsid protein
VTSVLEVLGTRRRLAARAAADAARSLEDGAERSPEAQEKLELALGDMRHYAGMYDALAPMADEIAEYRRGGRSLLRDMWAARTGDRSAAGRMLAHARAACAGALHEQRDIGGGSVWATVPTWLIDDAAPLSTSVAPLVRMLAKPLPQGASGTVNLVRWATAPTAGAQNGLGGALTTPSIADGNASVGVKSYGTRAKMSIQLLEQGRESIESQLVPAMLAAVDAQIEADMISADGTAGTVLGIRSTPSISTATYTDTTPTMVEAWPVIEGAVRATEIGMGGSPILVMSPRRLSWVRQRSIVENLASVSFDTPTLPGATVRIMGSVNIVADPAIPVTAGAGTEDVIIALRSPDVLDLFVGPPRVSFGDVDGAEVYVNVWRQVSFTAARLPAAVAVVGGSGFAAPTP